MQDPDLQRLLTALDSVVEWATANDQRVVDLADHLAVAELRLHCLRQRLGVEVTASPYLDFVRRLCAEKVAAQSARSAAAGA